MAPFRLHVILLGHLGLLRLPVETFPENLFTAAIALGDVSERVVGASMGVGRLHF